MKPMTALIQQIAKTSHQVFSKQCNEETLSTLRCLCGQLKASDVGFNFDSIVNRKFRAPSIHVHVTSNERFSIGIFVLPKDGSIPLHDHPKMFGIVKVIHGKIRVNSYSPIEDKSKIKMPDKLSSRLSYCQRRQVIAARDCGVKEVKCDDESTCLLTPNDANLHEIQAIDGSAAFVDVLAPPYEEGNRICTYFNVVDVSQDENLKESVTWLLPCEQPPLFWCESLPYCGPKVDNHL